MLHRSVAKRHAGAELFLVAPGSGTPAAEAASAARSRAVSAQALQVVHTMASSLRVDRSIATAVRHAAEHVGGPAAEELARLEWAVRIRHFQTVDDGFLAFAEAVGRSDSEFKRALLTLHGAEAEASREGLERRLDRAYDIVVRGEERRRERLAATLERPAQVLFGLAVVLPLVLASLFPMIQLTGGSFSGLAMGLLLVVAVPAATLAGASAILRRNFLGVAVSRGLSKKAAIASVAGPVAGLFAFASSVAAPSIFTLPAIPLMACACAAAGAAAGAWLLRAARVLGAESATIDKGLPDLLHAVGTKMVAGRSAEHALLEAVESSKDSALALRLRGALFDVIVGRRSLEDAIARDQEIRGAPRVLPALSLLAAVAARDVEAGGRVVLHLAEFERLRHEAAESLRSKVRAVADTTRLTVTIFAPLILGITAGMYGLLSRIGTGFSQGAAGASTLDAAGFAAIVVTFLALEVALADWFGARLLSDTPAAAFGRSLGRDVPLASVLFAAAFVGSAAIF